MARVARLGAAHDGADRARFLLERLVAQAGRVGASPPLGGTTPYVNTIPVDQEPPYPGDEAVEQRIRSLIRWNAMATVLQANKESSELGGHIASYQSAATLYEVGFNHFWHAPSEDHGGDLVFIQGHSAPGIYARAFLEGRLSEEQLRRFRQEIGENGGFDGAGISSYPHPWLMPDFWQFPTVSMGLGPIMAIYQARFMKYLQGREHRRHRGPQGVGASSATARPTSPSRWARSRWPAARSSTTSSSSSTATCSASTARCAATARSSRSSRPSSAARAGT